MINFPRAIVITGTPGVGKTVVSKALAKRLEAIYVSLAELVNREKLILSVDSARNTVVADLNQLSDRISQIIGDASTDVVVEGHYAPDVVSSNMVSYAFVLRMDPDILGGRLRARGYKEGKVLENLASEVLDVCLYDAVKQYGVGKVDEIDATYKSVEEVVEEILDVLNGRREVGVGKVDWLGKLEGENRLDEFFP